MAKHVFLSFVEEDLNNVNLFRGQAKNKKSDLAFDDYSVTTPYDSANAAYIKSQIATKISAASVTICLIGKTTHSSKWVKWEIEKSADLGKKVFGVRLESGVTIPSALTALGAKVVNWDIDAIVKEIG